MWLSYVSFCVNPIWHSSHQYLNWPVWIGRWRFKLDEYENIWGQWGHWNWPYPRLVLRLGWVSCLADLVEVLGLNAMSCLIHSPLTSGNSLWPPYKHRMEQEDNIESCITSQKSRSKTILLGERWRGTRHCHYQMKYLPAIQSLKISNWKPTKVFW